MRKLSFLNFLIIIALAVTSCGGNDPFLVAKNQVGELTATTTVDELATIFENDSLVGRLSEGILGYKGAYSQDDDNYLVYSSKGEHLLTIVPKEPLDSLSTIKVVEIHDARYKTEKGIGLDSKFAEIDLNTTISNVEATFTKVVLYVDKLNVTFTLNKLDLGINTIQTNDVQKEQIPAAVKPTSFEVWFD